MPQYSREVYLNLFRDTTMQPLDITGDDNFLKKEKQKQKECQELVMITTDNHEPTTDEH